jgi:hypothetical protein
VPSGCGTPASPCPTFWLRRFRHRARPDAPPDRHRRALDSYTGCRNRGARRFSYRLRPGGRTPLIWRLLPCIRPSGCRLGHPLRPSGSDTPYLCPRARPVPAIPGVPDRNLSCPRNGADQANPLAMRVVAPQRASGCAGGRR